MFAQIGQRLPEQGKSAKTVKIVFLQSSSKTLEDFSNVLYSMKCKCPTAKKNICRKMKDWQTSHFKFEKSSNKLRAQALILNLEAIVDFVV